MTNEEAIQWCRSHYALVSFFSHYGDNRVTVRPAGFPPQERDTFIEAVEAARNWNRETRAEGHADCCGRIETA